MKRVTTINILAGILLAAISNLAFANTALTSAAGYWKTVDDKTGLVLSQVQIYTKDNELVGKIVKIYPVLGQKNTDICTKCSGKLKNKRMLELPVIFNMKRDTSSSFPLWRGGHVLDPKSGNIYKGKMWLTDNGCKLHLRGFIGISLFGRNEVWNRVDKRCA